MRLIRKLETVLQCCAVLGSHLKAQHRLAVVAVHSQQGKLYVLVGAVKAGIRRSDKRRQLFRIFRRFLADQTVKKGIQSADTGSRSQRCTAGYQYCRCRNASCPLGHPDAAALMRLGMGGGLRLYPFQHRICADGLFFQRRHTVFFCIIVIKQIIAIPFHETAPFPMAAKRICCTAGDSSYAYPRAISSCWSFFLARLIRIFTADSLRQSVSAICRTFS